MFFIAIGAWLAGVIVSLINHNRKLPLTIFTIGAVTLTAHFTVGLGSLSTIIVALIAAVIWITNKLDMA